VTTAVLPGASGSSARFYEDITEKLRLKKERDELGRKLAAQSLNDEEIPSLLSRHGVLVSLEPLVARSRRYNSPLSLVVMGLSVKPEHQLLTRVTFLLKDQTRWADRVGCNEQREFILILQETTRDAALQLVEKLATQLASIETGEGALTACYGLTECQKNDNAASLLERAEAALFEARGNQNGTAIAV